MLQIKTVHNTDPDAFDEAVNAALEEGWTLTRRLTGSEGIGPGFVAELERGIITEAEHCCATCAHCVRGAHQEPCLRCSDVEDKWEPAT